MTNKDGKVIRRMWPTASFTFPVEQKEWIKAEAQRQEIPQSILMRALVKAAMDAQKKEAA